MSGPRTSLSLGKKLRDLMWILLAFIAVPVIEIGLFIQVGGVIGLWPTLLIVILTAIAGSWLVRNQGMVALTNLKSSINEMQDPTESLASGAMILVAGVLLLTPGFFTDAVGFLFLIPTTRNWIIAAMRNKIKTSQFEFHSTTQHNPPQNRTTQDNSVIDADYQDVTEKTKD